MDMDNREGIDCGWKGKNWDNYNRVNNKNEIKKTINNKEILRIIRNIHEQLYDNKLDNLEEIIRFLKTYNLPRLNHKDTEILNKPIMSKQIELVIKNLPQKGKSMTRRLHWHIFLPNT